MISRAYTIGFHLQAVGVFQGKKYQDAITALLKSGGDLMGFTPQGAEKMKDGKQLMLV